MNGYDAAKTFDLFSVSVTGLPKMERLLRVLSARPDCALVRGAIADRSHIRRVRRLLHPDPTTGEVATLRECSRRWLALDVEGLERPPGIQVDDLTACGMLARKSLPRGFRDAACLVQATAGHGLKPDCRLRLWFWLDRPTSGKELKRWFCETPADPSIFSPAQIIYTAAPIFAEGRQDHLPTRATVLSGSSDTVAVPALAAPVSKPKRTLTQWNATTPPPTQRYAFAVLRGATVRVSSAPVNTRHVTALREARRLAALVAAGVLYEADVRTALGSALTQAGKSATEWDAIVDWALTHPTTAALPIGASG